MEQAVLDHLLNVFPVFKGFRPGAFFIWKAVVFSFCYYLNWVNPKKYLWSGVCLLGIVPALFIKVSGVPPEPLAFVVRVYLIWMCAEVTYQSAAVQPEARIRGWWFLALVALFCL